MLMMWSNEIDLNTYIYYVITINYVYIQIENVFFALLERMRGGVDKYIIKSFCTTKMYL